MMYMYICIYIYMDLHLSHPHLTRLTQPPLHRPPRRVHLRDGAGRDAEAPDGAFGGAALRALPHRRPRLRLHRECVPSFVVRYLLWLVWLARVLTDLHPPLHHDDDHITVLKQFGVRPFLLSCLLVVVNDICAYLVGVPFGRTPLTKLSPKKSWYVQASLSRTQTEKNYRHTADPNDNIPVQCLSSSTRIRNRSTRPNPNTFLPSQHTREGFLGAAGLTLAAAPALVRLLRALLGPMPEDSMDALGGFLPLSDWQALWLAFFAAFGAPLGGILASAAKRAVEMKDFGQRYGRWMCGCMFYV